eukprot:CAMPEP_0194030798 /NCGR_PEP_ID=MMETSP0009_2-20130614/4141_1 /TAXON_ID=210454 /ORGANISM="Grammatophora oceanica, Strain CCMP 410" /LENGTH=224 /DNA_ID=CAMNT_0038670801 /DNA_START=17 /DNA_END=691 /DNA_ORIENTATION=-
MPPKHNQCSPSNNNSQLSADEKETFLQLYLLIDGVKCHYKYKPLRDFAFAVGVSVRSVRNWKKKKADDADLKLTRKTRSDKGQTVFNSNKRRRQNHGPSMMFKRAKVQGACRRGESITSEEVRGQWIALDGTDRAEYRTLSEDSLDRAPLLMKEVQQALMKTNGSISWKLLESVVRGGSGNVKLVSADSIRRFITSMDNFEYTKTRINPKLDEANKLRRYMFTK